MARVEVGETTLEERLILEERHYIDGAGPTNWHDPGTPLTLGELLVAMLTVSDNTATDMLIEHLGLSAINRRAAALVDEPRRLGPITRLVDVRREVYGALHPAARELTGLDFIALQKQPDDARRLAWLVDRLELAPRRCACRAWRPPSPATTPAASTAAGSMASPTCSPPWRRGGRWGLRPAPICWRS